MSTNRCVLLLSGPLSVGKTAVRAVLVSSHGFSNLRSSEYLRSVAKIRGLSTDRRILQEIGDGLDMSTDYRWLIDDVAYPVMEDNPSQGLWIVDAVRKLRQIEHFRNRFGATVHHIHFTASEEVLRARYYVRVLPVRMLDGMFRRADRLGWRVGTGAALREGGLVVPRHPVGGVRGDGRGVAL